MLTFTNLHLTQSATQANRNVISFRGILKICSDSDAQVKVIIMDNTGFLGLLLIP